MLNRRPRIGLTWTPRRVVQAYLRDVEDLLSGKSVKRPSGENAAAMIAEIKSQCKSKDFSFMQANWRKRMVALNTMELLFRIHVQLCCEWCDRIRSTYAPLTLAISTPAIGKLLAPMFVEKHNDLSMMLAAAESLEATFFRFPVVPDWLRFETSLVQKEISLLVGRLRLPSIQSSLRSPKQLRSFEVRRAATDYITMGGGIGNSNFMYELPHSTQSHKPGAY